MKRFSLNVMSVIGLIFLLSNISLRASAQNWTEEDKETWKRAVKRVVTTPPCCGSCSLFSMDEGRKAYKYITGEDQSGEGGKIYKDHDKKLLEAFHYFNPNRYEYWFGKSLKEETKP